MKQLFFLFFLFAPSLTHPQSKADGVEGDVGMAKVDSRKINVVNDYHAYDERGLFPVQNFSHEDYNGHPQNWFITHDRTGFIYTANGNGILEYDGVSWRLISNPGLHAVRTVVADQNNVKWVGADRDLGYLEPDSLGFLQFKSLKEKIPALHPLTGNVWQIFPDQDRILFVTENTIYSWTDNQFRIIPRPGEIHREYQVNKEVYFRILGKGMYRLNGDSLELIPDGKQFQHLRVDVALPYKNSSVLFASREAGLFVYNGKTITKFGNEVDDYIQENNLYAGRILSDSSYAFATLRAGVIIMDKYGKRVREITTKDGILNNQVYGMTQDNYNALWLALQTGISKIEPSLPYTFYDKNLGLEGTVSAIVRHKGVLYIGTYDGLFVQERRTGIFPATFRRIEGIQNGCFSLLSIGDDLLAASATGIFRVANGEVVQIKKLIACRTLFRSKRDPNRIFIGHRRGLSSVYFKNGQWNNEKDFEMVDGDIRTIAESDQGSLWLGTTLHNIIKIEFSGSDVKNALLNLEDIIINYYDDQHGLPIGTNTVYLIDDELLVHTHSPEGRLLKFDPRTGKFSKKTEFGKKFGIDTLTVYPLGYQNDGDYILLASTPIEGKSYRFSASKGSASGTYIIRRIYDEGFRSTNGNQLFWENNNLLWIGEEKVIRYDLNGYIDTKPLFKAYVRKVAVGQDSVIYGGNASSFFKPVLNYSNKGLRFEFAAPGLRGKEANQYQFRLQGFDSNWSDWTNETKKDYTNLSEGDYQFLVRGQNIYGEITTADVFNFEILAPWYRTWWAYVLYLLFFIGFLFIALQLRARQLTSEKKALERLVAERTNEIRSQADQLKIQAEKLLELDQAKSRFFANISHEFRTPLTLISGCLEDLTKRDGEEENHVRISVMQKNADRLRQLIEQLLDLSKLESGKLTLNVAPINPGNFLRAITSSFSSWAAQKQIVLSVDVPQHEVLGYMDEDVLEKIINNLLSNAIKFTPQQGQVSLLADWNAEELNVHVQDNGPGIPAAKIHQIFERFYQVDDSNTRIQEGSGIGLALVKELVSLHHGQIAVESQPGKRTSFKVTIPIHEKYYSSSEIGSVQNNKTSKSFVEFDKNAAVETYSEFTGDSSEKPIILVVEDNIDLGRYIGDHLPGCGIILAFNGTDGVNKAFHHVPDLIISDVMMPEMDGIEFCKKIKEDEKTSHIPVILLTAKADVESRLEGLETGADDYMTKPFNARELQTRIKNLILQREKLRERFSRTVILKPKDIAITSPDETFLEKVMAIVENHLSDSEFSVDVFQKEIGTSRMQLHRKLKALTGHSAGEFLRIQRLIRASEMLSKTDDNISEVCYQTGFTSLSYFAKCFKKQFGITPKDFASLHSQSR